MDAKQMREEFAGVKRRYYKENPKLCGRCGRSDSIHLHHKVALQDGGTNEFDNLIPLCEMCHKDWHFLEDITSFKGFMELPNVRELFALLEKDVMLVLENGEQLPLKTFLRDVRNIRRPFQENAYYDVLEEQKQKKP